MVKKQSYNQKQYMENRKRIYETNFPEKWDKLYGLLKKRLIRYYFKEMGFKNPLFEIILEKIAYLTVKLKYVENETRDIEQSKKAFESYSKILSLFNRTLEQLMKYTERANKDKSAKKVRDITEVKELSDEDLQQRLAGIVKRGKARVRAAAPGAKEARA